MFVTVLCVAVVFVLAILAAAHRHEINRRNAVVPIDKPIREVIEAISRPAVVHRRQRYVCGFAFHNTDEANTRPRVVLIRKVKPDWQAGKLNGVGGKIEIGEGAREAMAREFHEETGVLIEVEHWDIFAKMLFPKAEVVFLRAFHPAAALASTQTVFSEELGANITEPIEHRLVRGIDEIPEGRIMPNVRWAIPLAFHSEPERSIVNVEYAAHN